jgi:hypothetical protein
VDDPLGSFPEGFLILLATGPVLAAMAAMAAYGLMNAILGDDEDDDLDDAAE